MEWENKKEATEAIIDFYEPYMPKSILESYYYDQICADGKASVKWVSELRLFSLVKNCFPDITYQYHAEWLGKQSLDIYIPSRRIGIEYQGKPHFEAVDFFGGEEAFKSNRERDQRKRQLCKDQNVILIE